jgi:PIN domain nuclease of toxin-antitoxin system
LDLLIDTQALVWVASMPRRLTQSVRAAIDDGDSRWFVSAVTAYEYSDLNARGRFELDLPLQPILLSLSATVLDYPAQAWLIAECLPPLHRDPVDRMLVAHAIHAGLTLVTADATIRAYPVASLW